MICRLYGDGDLITWIRLGKIWPKETPVIHFLTMHFILSASALPAVHENLDRYHMKQFFYIVCILLYSRRRGKEFHPIFCPFYDPSKILLIKTILHYEG
jgi:hypothetical protein